MNRIIFAASALALSVAGCNQSTAPGNDREAELETPATPAAIEPASAALANVATAIIKPETLTEADVKAIGDTYGRCVFRLTEVGFASFVYEVNGQGFIKLNGKRIPLQAAGKDRFSSGDLLVATRAIVETGNAGVTAMEVVLVPPKAKDEIGIAGTSSALSKVI